MKKFILIFLLLLFPDLAHAKLIMKEIYYVDAKKEELKGYFVYDDKFAGKRPGIIIVHEWWGHNTYVRKRADMLAELGYAAFAIDMYGDGQTAAHPDEAGKFATAVMENFDTVGKTRFDAAMVVMGEQEVVDTSQIAAIGYCFGGGVVLNMARLGADLKGVASFHGGLATTYPAAEGKVKAKVLVCHGADDAMINEQQVADFKKEMDTAKVDYKFISYPGAKHSFTNPEADTFAQQFNLPVGYNKMADENSWQDLQNFLSGIFNK